MPPAQPDPESNVIHGVFQAFNRREDDFSISLGLVDDPMFWLRLDKDGDPGRVVFTDFKAGDQSDPVMVRAISTLLSERLPGAEADVVFHDLVPGQHDPAQYRIELNRVARTVRGWAETVARLMGRSVVGSRLETLGGKARFVMTLG